MTRILLVVDHAPSENTQIMRDAIIRGATDECVENVRVISKRPLDTIPQDVLSADAVVLGTTENLGYMSGALKDFFDRIYYPCLDKKQGLPCAVYIRAGHDGTGTCRAIETILTGLRWRLVQAPLVCRGDYKVEFAKECEELGLTMAASLDGGII
jgi:multimeric flavodoxin WrbA